MKFLSDACEYGLRAAVWLAQRPDETHKVRDIASATQAAPGYLVKVLQRLAKAGILSAQRGTQGGYTLLGDPEVLTVFDIINAVDPLERIHTCPLRLEAHGTELCPLHQQVDDAMAAIEQNFKKVTIAHLISQPSRSQPMCSALTIDH